MVMRKNGFSLVELMVVVAVLAIMGAVAVPNFVTGMSNYRMKRAASDLAARIRQARATAVKEHRDVPVRFIVNNNRYFINTQWYPESGQSLPQYYGDGISYGTGDATQNATKWGGSLPGDGVSFAGDGFSFNVMGLSTDTGYVYLNNGKGKVYAVGMETLGGAIYVRRWSGGQWYP
ncbi:MAG: prepilin-type N-terminal cleavage/methylation domain-containing protein [Deltaproteobacteria bacterium]|nr:prepilin-type N-terminal cleavage/methylation domain-containing protein [Deltaproteobacteria bacterium]